MKEHENDNDLYTSLKHCNAFLSREEDYRGDVYNDVQKQETTMAQFQKEMSQDALCIQVTYLKKQSKTYVLKASCK